MEWKVKYEKGVIEARGFKGGRVILTEKRETTGDTVAIRLTPDRREINADGGDVVLLKLEALDKEGSPVPTAKNSISFDISGEGTFLGVGNGDPNCQQSDKEPKAVLVHRPRATHCAIHKEAGRDLHRRGQGSLGRPRTDVSQGNNRHQTI